MKGISGWGYRPYRPADRQAEAALPFICRLAPGEDAIEVEWLDLGSDGPHALLWRRRDAVAWQRMAADAHTLRLEGLDMDTDYALRVVRVGDEAAASAERLARTGRVVGTVVNYLHPEDMLYAFSGRSLCSPSLVRLPSGALLASMDLYAPARPQNLTLIFRSDDGGATWRYVTDLFPCYWATLFVHRGRLYAQSCSTEYGDILIGCSDDEGQTWSKPAMLFPGSASREAAGWQRTPMPLLYASGRLCVSVDYGAWTTGGHAVGVLSIDEDADLMVSENWHVGGLIAYDPAWPGAPVGESTGILEASLVLDPAGRLVNIARLGTMKCMPNHGVAVQLLCDADDPDGPIRFDRFVALPSGSNSKTHIVQDAATGAYLAIGNLCVDPATPGQRNVLALQASEDLIDWRVVDILLDCREEDPAQVGFQYIYFIIDGDDILYLSRTAMNGARNYHDANYQTFHRISGFRALL